MNLGAIERKTVRRQLVVRHISSEKSLLNEVASEVVVCTKCKLSESRTNAVPGEGNPKSRIVVIGEAPGRSEDLEGRPFVGAAGKLLTALLAEIGLSRNEVFICNVVKCRPPRNREPLPVEIRMCTPYLDRQIAAIRPSIIVTLGNHSSAYVLSESNVSFSSITDAHGKQYKTVFRGAPVVVFPTFHPAAALYSGRYAEMLRHDFQRLKKLSAAVEP